MKNKGMAATSESFSIATDMMKMKIKVENWSFQPPYLMKVTVLAKKLWFSTFIFICVITTAILQSLILVLSFLINLHK